MSTSVVEAVFTQDADGTWLVDVPSLAGCHTYGETLEEARAHARDAIALWLETDDVEVVETVDAGQA